MDFSHAQIDLGGKPAQAPGAGGSGGGAIGPGARGGDGGPGGAHHDYIVTGVDVLQDVDIHVGRGGRAGVEGMPPEAGGNSSFGGLVAPGGGRKVHTPLPPELGSSARTLIVAAFFADEAGLSNDLLEVKGGGWAKYVVAALPAPFAAWLCVLVDIWWHGTDVKDIPVEVIADLETPSGTATFSCVAQVNVPSPSGLAPTRQMIVFRVGGSLHDQGSHNLTVSTNTGSRLDQLLQVVIREQQSEPPGV
jgi:hypothetical protein